MDPPLVLRLCRLSRKKGLRVLQDAGAAGIRVAERDARGQQVEKASSVAAMGIHNQHHHRRFRNSALRRALLMRMHILSAAVCTLSGRNRQQ